MIFITQNPPFRKSRKHAVFDPRKKGLTYFEIHRTYFKIQGTYFLFSAGGVFRYPKTSVPKPKGMQNNVKVIFPCLVARVAKSKVS